MRERETGRERGTDCERERETGRETVRERETEKNSHQNLQISQYCLIYIMFKKNTFDSILYDQHVSSWPPWPNVFIGGFWLKYCQTVWFVYDIQIVAISYFAGEVMITPV